MRTVDTAIIIDVLAKNIRTALMRIEPQCLALLQQAAANEQSERAAWALGQIVQNAQIAEKTNSYACQDCGQAVIFASVGQDVHVAGNLTDAINQGVRLGYADARKSVADALGRQNTGTNTPAVIHYDIVPGDGIALSYLSKGAGSENMSAVFMLTPSVGTDGIVNAVKNHVIKIGANPCPPIILGIGIGGTMEKCALLSKQALIRPTKEASRDAAAAELERRILAEVNSTGIGAQGFGGNTTALAVHVLTAPTHIGMLPVAVNVQCHSVRHFTARL